MDPKERIRLATTKVSPHIQSELEKLRTIFLFTGQCLEEIERSGNIFSKNAQMSTKDRKAGNQLYVQKGHDSLIHNQILYYYTRSIAFAPGGTEELALGYGNRSSLLMHFHLYKESLVDIDRALKLSNSVEYKKKLEDRKEKCLELIKKQNSPDPSKNKDLEKLASKLNDFKPSATIPCASDCVGFAYNHTFGRQLVATRDIKPGEILIVEEGQVCYPNPDQLYIVCSHCLQIAWNGIPCDKCTSAIYCSEECKNKAFHEYHDIECPLVKYLDSALFNNEQRILDRMTSVRLLIRAVKKEGFESIIKGVSKIENQESLDALLTNGILQSDKLVSLHNLLSHSKEFKGDKELVKVHSIQIIYLLIKYTDFLVPLLGKNITKNFPFAMLHKFDSMSDLYSLLALEKILTKLKHVISINGYLFQKSLWMCDCKDIDDNHDNCKLMKGVIIVPCCSLLNHSCTPNVTHLSVPKKKIIVFSTCPIKKGEQLFDAYQGLSILNSDWKIRKSRFEKIHFTCKCKACLDKIDPSMVSNVCNKSEARNLVGNEGTYPTALIRSFLNDPVEDLGMSEDVMQNMIKISQLFYKHFNYYKAYAYSTKCKSYIENMMSTLYEDNGAVPKGC